MSLEVRGLWGCFSALQKINTFHVMLWIFFLSTSHKLSRVRHWSVLGVEISRETKSTVEEEEKYL